MICGTSEGASGSSGFGATEKGEKLQAWNIEADYTFEVAGKETVAGVAYQGVKDVEEGYPEARPAKRSPFSQDSAF